MKKKTKALPPDGEDAWHQTIVDLVGPDRAQLAHQALFVIGVTAHLSERKALKKLCQMHERMKKMA